MGERTLWVVNGGSSSLKHELFAWRAGAPVSLWREVLPRDEGGAAPIERALASLRARGDSPEAVVHRIVLGPLGAGDVAPVDDRLEEELRRLSALAPLHNPPALAALGATRALGVPVLAAFDSAFHATLPARALRYALPAALDLPGIPLRRFGYHGWAHRWVTERYAALTGVPAPTLISLHLGGGASAAAIRAGRSVDTSMGLTPLEGLVMGTRAGDLDPGLLLALVRAGVPVDRLDDLLHHRSGLQALAGTADMRVILQRAAAGDADADAAVDAYCYRAVKYAGAYLAALGGAEAIVFTGGVGEHQPEIRRRIAGALGFAGLTLDPARANEREGRLSVDGARLHAWVIPAQEERLIARAAAQRLLWT